MKCKFCGEENTSLLIVPTNKDSEEEVICISCDTWKNRANKLPTEDKYLHPIIDGTYYTIGDENSTSHFRGFDGARFQIEFNDGHKVISTNLWYGGDIPTIWQDKLPNNARFENNLKWKTLSSGTQILTEQKI